MSERLTFTPDSKVEFSSSIANEPSVEAVHLRDLSFVLDIDQEDGEVTRCTIDVAELVKAMTLYASMEELRYDWR